MTDDTEDTEENVGCVVGENELNPECLPIEPPALILPEDLTIGQEDLRWIGWYLPTMCSNLEVGSVTAIFCPELRYLVDTEELLASSVSSTQNYLELEENEDLLRMTVHSMSQESSHRNAMIFIINRNEVWRIEAG